MPAWQAPGYKYQGDIPSNGDLEAAAWVIHDVRESSENYDPADAIERRILLQKLKAAAQEAIDMLDMSLIKLMDGQPMIIRDGQKFWIGPKTDKEVVDHDAVIRWVQNRARDVLAEIEAPPETVEEGVTVGAGAAARVMRDLYLSDSTRVKKTELDRYGIPRSVIDVQRGAKQVKQAPAGGEPDS